MFISGTKFTEVTAKIKQITAKQLGAEARKVLIDETTAHGWKRFKGAIIQRSINKDTEEVLISDKNNAKNIAGFLEFGTKAHGPVTAQALRFKPKGSGKFIFRKFVRGIKASPFWEDNPKVGKAVTALIEKMMKVK